MFNAQPPPYEELPSSRTLLRSTITALVTAIALLIAVVLPAEYGIDPTGMGEVLGLTQMGETKVALARAAAVADSLEIAGLESAAASLLGTPPDSASHVTEVTLGPNEGKEVKLVMRQGAQVNYSWSTDRGTVGFDLHGDRLEAGQDSYHSYEKGSGVWSDEGTLTALFDGRHGWFWRNQSAERITLTLQTNGSYQDLQ